MRRPLNYRLQKEKDRGTNEQAPQNLPKLPSLSSRPNCDLAKSSLRYR